MTSLDPGCDATTSDAEALVRCGEDALAEEQLAAAVALLDRAETAGAEPDRCAGNRWLAHMLGGDFGGAWRESDAIRRRGAPDPHRFWNGEPWAGRRLILRSLHGFGDAVQMFRFLPRLRGESAHLIVEVPPRLVELAPCFEGMGEVITWGAAAPAEPPAFDVQMEVMELPHALRVGCGNLKPQTGYLRVPETLIAETATAVGPSRRPRVGLVWTEGHWNPSRSVPFSLVRALADVTGIEFWSLESRHEGLLPADLPAGWRDVYECGDGMLRLTATVARMDLVITVDTLAAHLAGALGVPCWLLLQHRADWRWMAARTDSPWYPTLRLWRQSAPGDWAELLRRVGRELRSWASDPERRIPSC